MELPKARYSDLNRDHILRFLEAGGQGNTEGILLSAKQQELFNRWQFAAEKIREQKYKREVIANFIAGSFNVSKDTAWRDIVNAEYVFSAGHPLNKKFIIHNRIEFLQAKINEAYIDKDYQSAAMLEKVLQRYIELYPEIHAATRPQQVIFLVNNNLHVTNITHEQAYQDADEVIKQLEKYGDTRE